MLTPNFKTNEEVMSISIETFHTCQQNATFKTHSNPKALADDSSVFDVLT